MTATTRKRTRPRRPQTQPDGPLQLAQRHLTDAIHDLTNHRYHPLGWLPSRYTQLADSLRDATVTGHARTQPSSHSPVWLDALKLKIDIDRYTAQHDPGPDTPTRCQQILRTKWRPQDSKHIETIAAALARYNKTIDDLFDNTARRYLYDPLQPDKWATCPHCGHDHAYIQRDDATTVRVPALAVNAEHGAECQHCHDRWPPDHLQFLARQLGCPPPEGTT